MGEITNDELARRVEHLGADLHDDLTRIEVQLGKLVPRELYEAHRLADARQVAALEQRIVVMEGRGRWMVASVIMPVVSIIVMVWLAMRGGTP